MAREDGALKIQGVDDGGEAEAAEDEPGRGGEGGRGGEDVTLFLLLRSEKLRVLQ